MFMPTYTRMFLLFVYYIHHIGKIILSSIICFLFHGSCGSTHLFGRGKLISISEEVLQDTSEICSIDEIERTLPIGPASKPIWMHTELQSEPRRVNMLSELQVFTRQVVPIFQNSIAPGHNKILLCINPDKGN